MALAVGLLLGLGVLVALRAGTPRRPRRRSKPGWPERTTDLLATAGVRGVSPLQLVAASVAVGLVAFVAVLGLSQVLAIAIAFGGFAGLGPLALLRRRRRRRSLELRELWPEAVDNLASAVRAGMSLPEGLSALAVRGPEQLRPSFARFAQDYRISGRFGESLDRLKADLADPVGDRVAEALRTAREVGGTDLGRLLRTLSTFLREDARTRSELEVRQGWTVAAARLALAAPWAMLLLLSVHSAAVAAYRTSSGVVVLAVGGGVSYAAYRVMVRIARLPEERRVLR